MRFVLRSVLLLFAFLVGAVGAEPHAGWLAEYFVGNDAAGQPVVRRVDPAIYFNWDNGSPDPSLPVDGFAVRWTAQVTPPVTGTYTITVRSDDGTRLWVNGQLLVDDWTTHAVKTTTVTLPLTAGTAVPFELEFFEYTGPCSVNLSWEAPGLPTQVIAGPAAVADASSRSIGTGTGLVGHYFNTITPQGTPILTRIDPTIAFNWGNGSPDSSIPADRFSARWMGWLEPRFTGDHVLIAQGDDGVRVYLDDVKVIDDWSDHGLRDAVSAPIRLERGRRYRVGMEMYENGGGAGAQLLWKCDGLVPRQYIPMGCLYPAAEFEVNWPTASIISPACVEGRRLTRQSVAVSSRDTALTTVDLGDLTFYVDVPLDATQATPVVARDHAGNQVGAGSIVWQPTLVKDGEPVVAIRVHDSLLLQATGAATLSIGMSSGTGTGDTPVPASGLVSRAFTEAGFYTVFARAADGSVLGSRNVSVVSVPYEPSIACEVNFERPLTLPIAPDLASIVFAPGDATELAVRTVGSTSSTVDLRIRPLRSGTSRLVARAGSATGPIAWVKDIGAFKLEVKGKGGIVYSADTGLGDSTLIMRPYVERVWVDFNMFAGRATFYGGMRRFVISSSNEATAPESRGPVGIGQFERVVEPETGEVIGRYPILFEMRGDRACYRTVAGQTSSPWVTISTSSDNNPKSCPAKSFQSLAFPFELKPEAEGGPEIWESRMIAFSSTEDAECSCQYIVDAPKNGPSPPPTPQTCDKKCADGVTYVLIKDEPGKYDKTITGQGDCSGSGTSGAYYVSRLDAHGTAGGTTDPLFKSFPLRPKRKGTVFDPVIIVRSGGQNNSFYGTEECPTNNTWTMQAKADVPTGDALPARYRGGSFEIKFDPKDGSSERTYPAGSSIPDVTATYVTGRYIPTLKVYYKADPAQSNCPVNPDAPPELVATAEIHSIVVEKRPSKNVQAAGWSADAACRVPFELSNQAGGLAVDSRLSGSGGVRLRVSLDGYPQNEYWGGGEGDGIDFPQVQVVPEGARKVALEGYGRDVGNASLLVEGQALLEICESCDEWIPDNFVVSNWWLTDVEPVKIVDVNLHIDSDNNDQLNPPSESEDEDSIEEALPGKSILAACGDADGDECPDFADGINRFNANGSQYAAGQSAPCAPLVLRLRGINVSTAKVKFTYDANNPASLPAPTTLPNGRLSWNTGSGSLRLWTKNGNEARRVAAVTGGDFLPSERIVNASDLPTISGGDGVGIRLFVEGVQTISGTWIKVEVDPDGQGNWICDRVRVTVDGVDLDVDSDNTVSRVDTIPERTDAEDQIEDISGDATKPGRYIWVNDGDLNDQGAATGLPNYANPNDDLKWASPAVIHLPIDRAGWVPANVKVRFTFTEATADQIQRQTANVNGETIPYYRTTAAASAIRLYRRRPAGDRTEISSGTLIRPNKDYSYSDLGGDDCFDVWIEGIAASTAVAQGRILIEVSGDGSSPAGSPWKDSIRYTVIRRVDVDVDSRNTGAVDGPGTVNPDDLVVDAIEEHVGSITWPGVAVPVAAGDLNSNGIPNLLDAAGSSPLRRLTVTVPRFVPMDKVKMQFAYLSGGAGFGDETTARPAPDGGLSRLWPEGNRAAGSAIPPNDVRTAADFGFTIASYRRQFALEGASNSTAWAGSVLRAEITQFPGGIPERGATDRIFMTNFEVDLDVPTDTTGRPGADSDNIEDQANQPGAFVPLNTYDIDEDGIRDDLDFNAGGPVAGDEPFIKGTLRLLKPLDPATCRVQIVHAPNIRLWKKPWKQPRTVADILPQGAVLPAGVLVAAETEIWIEGLNVTPAGSSQIRVEVDPDGSARPLGFVIKDAVRLTVRDSVGLVDLDIDSDNNDGYGLSGTEAEDSIEDASGRGKIGLPNFGDFDRDGINDWYDGILVTGGPTPNAGSCDRFYQMKVKMDLLNGVGTIDLEKASITFSYAANDPRLLRWNPAANSPSYQFFGLLWWHNPWGMRIWRKDGSAVRDPSQDFVRTQAYPAAQFGLGADGKLDTTLFLEMGYLWNDIQAITVTAQWKDEDGNDHSATDTVNVYSGAPLRLLADANHDGTIDDNDDNRQAMMVRGFNLPNHGLPNGRIPIAIDRAYVPEGIEAGEVSLQTSRGRLFASADGEDELPRESTAPGSPYSYRLPSQTLIRKVYLEAPYDERVDVSISTTRMQHDTLTLTLVGPGIGAGDGVEPTIAADPGFAEINLLRGNLFQHERRRTYATADLGPSWSLSRNSLDRLGIASLTDSYRTDADQELILPDSAYGSSPAAGDMAVYIDGTGRRYPFQWKGTRFDAVGTSGISGAYIVRDTVLVNVPPTTATMPLESWKLILQDNLIRSFDQQGRWTHTGSLRNVNKSDEIVAWYFQAAPQPYLIQRGNEMLLIRHQSAYTDRTVVRLLRDGDVWRSGTYELRRAEPPETWDWRGTWKQPLKPNNLAEYTEPDVQCYILKDGSGSSDVFDLRGRWLNRQTGDGYLNVPGVAPVRSAPTALRDEAADDLGRIELVDGSAELSRRRFSNETMAITYESDERSGAVKLAKAQLPDGLANELKPRQMEITCDRRKWFPTTIEVKNWLGGSETIAIDPQAAGWTSWTDAAGVVLTRVLDRERHRVQKETNGRSETSYGYDALSNITSVRDAEGGETSATYSQPIVGANFLVRSSRAGVLGETVITYSTGSVSAGRVLRSTDPCGDVVRYGYDTTKGHLATITDERGKVWQVNCDAYGQPVRVRSPEGRIVYHLTDKFGQTQATIDHLGYVEATTFDPIGRELETYLSDGATVVPAIDDASIINTPDRLRVDRFEPDRYGIVLSGNTYERISYNSYRHDRPAVSRDPQDRLTQFTYDALGRILGEHLVVAGAVPTTYAYAFQGSGGYIRTVKLAERTLRTETIDGSGRARSESTPLTLPSSVVQATTTSEYTAEGWLKLVRDPLLAKTGFIYDRAGRQVAQEQPDGSKVFERQYDPAGRLIYERQTDGESSNVTYDGCDRAIEVRNARGGTVTSTYVKGLLQSERNSLGLEVRYEYDNDGERKAMISEQGLRVAITLPKSLADGRKIVYNVPALLGLKLTQHLDALGRVGRVETALGSFDLGIRRDGEVLSKKMDGQATVGVLLDDQDRVVESYNEGSGEKTKTTYDPTLGDVVKKTAPGGLETKPNANPATGESLAPTDNGGVSGAEVAIGRIVERDAVGRTTKFIDAEERPWTQGYDVNGRPSILRGPDGRQVRRTYTTGGKPKTVTVIGRGNSPSLTTTYHYDSGGTLTRVDSPAGEQSWQRDAFGRVQVETRNGQSTRTAYDAKGRVGTVTSPGGDTTRYTYNTSTGLMETVTDGRGLVTRFGYDSSGRRTTRTSPAGRKEQVLSFWPSGQPRRLRDAANRETEMTYDTAGRLSKVEFIGTSEAIGYGYSFDANGSQITETYTNGAVSDAIVRRFDRRGRLVELRLGAEEPVLFSYRNDGSLATKGHLRFEYNGQGYLVGVVDTVSGERATLGYDSLGRNTSIDLPLGMRRRVSYDTLGRLSEIQVGRGADVDTWTLGYDQQQRIRRLDGPDGRHLYGYDTNGRLRSETRDSATDSVQNVYNYDGNGNRTRKTEWRPRTVTEAVDLRSAALPPEASVAVQAWTPDVTGVLGEQTTVAPARLTLSIPSSQVLNLEFDPIETGLAAGEAVRAGVALWPSASGEIAVLAEVTPLSGGTLPYQLRLALWRRPTTGSPQLMAAGEPIAVDGRPLVMAVLKMADGVINAQAWQDTTSVAAVSADIGDAGGTGLALVVDGDRLMAAPAARFQRVLYDRDASTWREWVSTYDADNHLLGITGAETASFTYNTLGHRATETKGGSTTLYGYDRLDRLTAVGGTQFRYFGASRLQATATIAGDTARFRYDGRDLISMRRGNGGETRFGALGRTALWTNGPEGVRVNGHDPFGNVATEWSGVGPSLARVRQTDYDAFGPVAERTRVNGASAWSDGTVGSGVRYKGHWYNAEVGFTTSGARALDHARGRFVSDDPARAGRNFSNYCDSDPINRSDPSGLDWAWNSITQAWDETGETAVPEPPAWLTPEVLGSAYIGATDWAIIDKAASRAGDISNLRQQMRNERNVFFLGGADYRANFTADAYAKYAGINLAYENAQLARRQAEQDWERAGPLKKAALFSGRGSYGAGKAVVGVTYGIGKETALTIADLGMAATGMDGARFSAIGQAADGGANSLQIFGGVAVGIAEQAPRTVLGAMDAYQTGNSEVLGEAAGNLAVSLFLRRFSGLSSWAATATSDFVKGAGYLGGPKMTRRMLRSYERQLDNLGMKFSRNADLILDKMGGKLAAGGFDRAVKTVYLRRGATRYQAYHELQHALHFNSIGAKAYAGMGTFAREMHVFRQIWKNRGEFTRLEVRDAIRYGKDLRLLRKLGRID